MQSDPERPTILIAERDPSVRELQEHFLGRAGLAVEFAGDGMAALERARLLRPAVVITEILIPRLDGLALCRRLGEDPDTRDIPVLVFSILAAAPRAAEAGAKAYLRKPLVESLFVATVQQLIEPPIDILETQ
jgi:two-component system response regulator MprA